MENFAHLEAPKELICQFGHRWAFGSPGRAAVMVFDFASSILSVLMSRDFCLGVLIALTGTLIHSRLLSRAASSGKSHTIKKTTPKTVMRKYTGEETKMCILMRNDLNMTKGKAAAQACHAVLATYKEALKRDPSILEAWERTGQAKVTLRVESEEEMMDLVKRAREMGLTAQYIRDAGRTQLAPNTTTVAALGPAPKNLLDLVTGHLKLY